MKKSVILFFVMLMAFAACTNTNVDNEKQEGPIKTQNEQVARYSMYETKNMWNFLKLDTQTGKIWQVQYSINEDDKRFETPLNEESLLNNKTAVNGRYCLYPTNNIYNFILLDQITGESWQVQWSFEPNQRFVIPIQ